MKVYLNYIFLILSALYLFCSCSEEELHNDKKDEIKEEINLLSELSVFSNDQTEQTVTFLSAKSWTASTDQKWCSVVPSNGNSGKNTINVSVLPNNGYEERNAALILSSGSIQKHLTIIQKQNQALLLESSKKEVSAKGEIVEVSVKSNVKFSFFVDETAVEWVVPISNRSLETTTLRFKIKENEYLTKREANIYFISGDLRETFTIYQQGTNPEFIFTQNKYDVSSKGGEIKVELKSNFPYEIIMPEVDWVKQVKDRSLSTYTHYFKVFENTSDSDRTTEILFKQKNTDKLQKIQIRQLQKNKLIVDNNTYTIEADGGKFSVNLSTNVSYEITSPSWIHKVNPQSRALQRQKIEFIVDKNPQNTERKGIILLRFGDSVEEINVIQTGRFGIELLTSLLHFSPKGQTQKLEFNSMADWTVLNDIPWCSVSPLQGHEGHNSVQITVEDINDVAQRVDSLYIKSGHICKAIPIIQKNQDSLLIVSDDFVMSGSCDTIISVKLRASYDVDFIIPDSISEWVKPLEGRSLYDRVIKFKVLKNLNVLGRTGYIRFINGKKHQDLKLTQEGVGPLMFLSTEKIELSSNASEFELTVKSNYKYEIKNGGQINWIRLLKSTIIPSQEPGFIITKHRFKIDENASINLRIGYINFFNTEYIKDFGLIEDKFLRVFQKSKFTIETSSSKFEIPASGEVFSFDVLSDVDYSIKTTENWISQVPNSRGTVKSETLSFKAAPNTNITSREGYILLSYQKWEKKIHVLQEEFKDYGILLVNKLSDFESVGGIQELTFNASEDWTATVTSNWCKLSEHTGQSGENTISVIVDKNSEFHSRKATLSFRCGKHYKEVQIVQKQKDHIEVDKDSCMLAWNTTNFNLNVKANCKYSVDVVNTGNWIRLKENSRSLVLSSIPFVLDKNEGKLKREAIITLRYKDILKKVKVVQQALDSLTILTPNVDLVNDKDTIIKVKLVSNKAVTVNVNNDAKKWIIQQNPSRALTTFEYSFKVLKNVVEDRTGTITFSNGSKSTNYIIKQKGKGLILQMSTAQIEANCTETVKEIIVTANFKYNLVLGVDWIKESSSEVMSKNEDGLMKVKHSLKIAPNDSVNARTTNIGFNNIQYPSLGQITKLIRVNQKGKDDIKVPKGDFFVPAKASDLTVKIETNVDFDVKCSESWVTYVAGSRSGYSKRNLLFKIENNTVESPRECIVTLKSALCSKTFKIVQKAFDDYGIRIITKPKVFLENGGKQELKFDSSQDWFAHTTDTWYKLSVKSGAAGEGNTITITAEPNTNFKVREGKLIIESAKDDRKQEIKISQMPIEHVIELSDSIFKATAESTQFNVTVKANCKYEVTPKVSWIKVKAQTKSLVKNQITLIVDKNIDTKERIGTVDIISEGLKKFITITQEAHKEIKPTPDSGK